MIYSPIFDIISIAQCLSIILKLNAANTLEFRNGDLK